jgi:hypothetical protein
MTGKNETQQPEILVLGEHPATYLAAALVRHKSKIHVAHCTIPDQPDADRLVVVNPNLFSLHKLLEPLKRKLELTAVYGLRFLSDEAGVASEYRSKSALSYVTSYKAARAAMRDVAEAEGWNSSRPST